MAVFAYEGRTTSGKVLRGNMEAPSREAVINRLRAQRRGLCLCIGLHRGLHVLLGDERLRPGLKVGLLIAF
jgi:hypothetical protein